MATEKEVIGIIPARYSSVRLQAKPLVDICGIPMIVRVWQNASKSKIMKNVTVATDDKRIIEVCDKYKIPTVITPSELPSGTDRVYVAYKSLSCKEQIVVNIQGDEPLISSDDIDIMLNQFLLSDSDVGTLVTEIKDIDDLFGLASVKVVLDSNKNAMYFSRSPIPCLRDFPKEVWLSNAIFWKHIGIYAYKIEALENFVKLPLSKYESFEKLEQLRLLEQGVKFLCVETKSNLIGVDTQEDLDKVINILKCSIN
jgi:3-deoxy-manno-octulosonate cytidylyltransferase (CMP-KDO synthetase)